MNDKYLQIESEQRQHNETLRQDNERYNMSVEHRARLSKIHYCKITKDENQWCCLSGENLQEGIAGFGDTPAEAIWNWSEEFGYE